ALRAAESHGRRVWFGQCLHRSQTVHMHGHAIRHPLPELPVDDRVTGKEHADSSPPVVHLVVPRPTNAYPSSSTNAPPSRKPPRRRAGLPPGPSPSTLTIEYHGTTSRE